MRKIILYSAMSLDGFIARPDGEIDWLFDDQDYGYSEFLQRIDTTLMGNRTYQQILTFGDFPYTDKTNYVFTRSVTVQDDGRVQFVYSDLVNLVTELKQQLGRDIWLIGGRQINTVLLNAELIDEMILSVHPTVLGSGVPLFGG
ncbi:MAG: dihydrofolate reductase family protein [Bacteroidota bacterium]